ncbi:MAG: hypothetical protein KAV00_13955, partial [Phycisphaerae bacterium]|nr:hypothetical protein [Phycisphaerae bacterium]
MKPRNILLIALLFIAGPLMVMMYMQNNAAQPKPTVTATAPTSAPATATTAPETAKTSETKSPAATQPARSGKTPWPVKKWPVKEVVLGSTDKKDGFKFQVRLTSLGAAVETIKL